MPKTYEREVVETALGISLPATTPERLQFSEAVPHMWLTCLDELSRVKGTAAENAGRLYETFGDAAHLIRDKAFPVSIGPRLPAITVELPTKWLHERLEYLQARADAERAPREEGEHPYADTHFSLSGLLKRAGRVFRRR